MGSLSRQVNPIVKCWSCVILNYAGTRMVLKKDWFNKPRMHILAFPVAQNAITLTYWIYLKTETTCPGLLLPL